MNELNEKLTSRFFKLHMLGINTQMSNIFSMIMTYFTDVEYFDFESDNLHAKIGAFRKGNGETAFYVAQDNTLYLTSLFDNIISKLKGWGYDTYFFGNFLFLNMETYSLVEEIMTRVEIKIDYTHLRREISTDTISHTIKWQRKHYELLKKHKNETS